MFQVFRRKDGSFVRASYHHGHFLTTAALDPLKPGGYNTELWITHKECDPVNSELQRCPTVVNGHSLNELEIQALLENPEDFLRNKITRMICDLCP